MKIFTVDAFTNDPFTGNPAAVVPLEKELDDVTMQKIAAEMNLSETAFVVKRDSTWDRSQKFCLRWFTPTKEVELCGHATLATAHVIFSEFRNTSENLEFETLSGTLLAIRDAEGIKMNLPSLPPVTIDRDEELEKLIQATTNCLPIEEIAYNETSKKLLIRLKDHVTREQLESIEVDFSCLAEHDGSRIRGIIVTVTGKNYYDILSRYFAPWNGIPEDPVTGSAHSVLIPFWTKKLGKNSIKCRQCSRRGGELIATLKEDRVDMTGRAVTVLEGNLRKQSSI